MHGAAPDPRPGRPAARRRGPHRPDHAAHDVRMGVAPGGGGRTGRGGRHRRRGRRADRRQERRDRRGRVGRIARLPSGPAGGRRRPRRRVDRGRRRRGRSDGSTGAGRRVARCDRRRHARDDPRERPRVPVAVVPAARRLRHGARPQARGRPRVREVPRRAGRRWHAVDHPGGADGGHRPAGGSVGSRRVREGVPGLAGARSVLHRRTPRAGRCRSTDGWAAEPHPPIRRLRWPADRARLPRARRCAHLHQPAVRAGLHAGPGPGRAARRRRRRPPRRPGRPLGRVRGGVRPGGRALVRHGGADRCDGRRSDRFRVGRRRHVRGRCG